MSHFVLNDEKSHTKFITAKHHILPQAKMCYPEFVDLKENEWNGCYLTHQNHYIAHFLLAQSIDNRSVIFAWNAMKNKDKHLRDIDIYEDSSEYGELMKKAKKAFSDDSKILESNGLTKGQNRGKRCSNTKSDPEWKNTTGRDSAKKFNETMEIIDGDGLSLREKTTIKRNKTMMVCGDDGQTIFQRAGKKGAITRMVEDEDGNSISNDATKRAVKTKSVPDENGETIYQKAGKKVSEKLNIIEVNGKTKAQNRGEKISKIRKEHGTYPVGINSPSAKKINFLDEMGNIQYSSNGDFKTVCVENGLPYTAFLKSLNTNQTVYKNVTHNGTIGRLVNKGVWKYKGWSAIYLT